MNNDLISREALIQHAYSAVVDGVEKDIIDLSDVDNAPTVEAPTELCKDCRFLKDCETCEEKLRPQGAWNYIQAGMCVCPFCGAMPHKLYKNYCAKCGAELKGGTE